MLTRTTESLAAIVKVSAQDTIEGHALSSASLIAWMTINPLAESQLGFDSFSLTMLSLLSNKNKPSQPYYINLELSIWIKNYWI